MISVGEVVRSGMIDEDTEKRKGVAVRSFPTSLVFIQSDKSLSLIDLATFDSKEVATVKFGYSALHVEYSQREKNLLIYTNKRQGQERNIQVIEIPLTM
jgi:hypothetical protein